MNGRWAILLSGRGSTAQAMMDLADQVRVSVVCSPNPKALGLARARRLGIPTHVLKPLNWDELHQDLLRRRIDKIFLLGFMRILPETFISKWQVKIWNIHPSLLPSYPGLSAFERAFENKDPLGASVHQVTLTVDAGPVFKQRALPSVVNQMQSLARQHLASTEQYLIRHSALSLSQRGSVRGL